MDELAHRAGAVSMVPVVRHDHEQPYLSGLYTESAETRGRVGQNVELGGRSAVTGGGHAADFGSHTQAQSKC